MSRFASVGQEEEGRTITAKKRRDSPGNGLAETGHGSGLSYQGSGGHKNKSETDNPARLTAWLFSENLAKKRLRGTHSAALLEALAAKDRAALGGAEGNGGVLATLGTGGFGF
jgi:hypothetical protein